ncbi:carbon-phosphorus lyase complex subunit PhnI [Brevibacterium daeguense]|uniref:Carbon-phosphorus lyase complex subunit PhnI n=1 Tax=Brevibacterium daeguense TaxID=909936 RepID=A0ABP8EGE9_9MICO|nr:carbon-phosphorus lyase complex subunit PhnI [Brevibacterium daeguense]
MGYAGTNKGGTSAILAAEELLRSNREAADEISVDAVLTAFPAIIDRIMGEGGLWHERTAAAAFIQAGGDTAEAVHLLRAHRSTLPRLTFSLPIEPDDMALCRRVVPAHRSPDGPQLLGETVDYSPRIIRRGVGDPLGGDDSDLVVDDDQIGPAKYPDRPVQRYTRFLAAQGLLVDRRDESDPEPYDLALNPITLPAPRSARLSAMSLAETGALVNLWYRGVIGPDGHTDESVTLGEVRYGRLGVRVTHPHTGNPVQVGEIRATECESMAHLDERGEDASRFDAGYGFAMGHNERKAIAMANMDLAAQRYASGPAGWQTEQVIMHTTDGLAANGFLEHLKLPHYVTFQSMIDRALAARAEDGKTSQRELAEDAAEQPAQDAAEQPAEDATKKEVLA